MSDIITYTLSNQDVQILMKHAYRYGIGQQFRFLITIGPLIIITIMGYYLYRSENWRADLPAIIIAILVVSVFFGLMFLNWRRNFIKSISTKEPHSVQLCDDGICINNHTIDGKVNWSVISKVQLFDNLMLFLTGNDLHTAVLLALPRHAFSSDEEFENFFQQANNQCTA